MSNIFFARRATRIAHALLGVMMSYIFSDVSALHAQVLGEALPNERPVKEQTRLFLRSVQVGLSPLGLAPRPTNQSTEDRFTLDRNVLSFAIRLDNALIYIDYGQGSEGGTNQTFLSGGARFDVDNYFSSPEAVGFKFALPISLITDIIFASNASGNAADDLRLFSLGLGTGGTFIYNTRSWITLVRSVVFVAFATQGFGDFAPQSSGTLTGLTSGFLFDATVEYPDITFGLGLALSYRFRYVFSNFSSSQFDYFLRQHTVTAGITF